MKKKRLQAGGTVGAEAGRDKHCIAETSSVGIRSVRDHGRTRLTPSGSHGYHVMTLAFPLRQYRAAKAFKGQVARASGL